MNFKSGILILIFLFSAQQIFAQRNFDSYNRLGLSAGISIFDIQTSDLQTKAGHGFTGGFTSRGSFWNAFDLIYGITFINSKIGIEGSLLGEQREIEYTIQGAQVHFLGSYNIVKHHLSLEFGPILNINGKMKLEHEEYGNHILKGYNTLRAQDVQEISRFNFHVAGGITAGFESFRLSALYQYGVTNTLGKLNEKNLENDDFEGHSSLMTISAIVYF